MLRLQHVMKRKSVLKNPNIEQPEFLSIPAAAKLCGVSRNTMYSWVRQEKLKAYKTPGRTNLIRPSDLVHFMQKSGMFVPPGLTDLARRDAGLGGDSDLKQDEVQNTAILIVDDEPIIRSVMVKALDGLCPIYQAETGYEALHLLTMRKDIGVILLDVVMPGQAGYETFDEIKKLKRDIDVFMVTGFANDIPDQVKDDPQIKAILHKPVKIEVLRERVAASVKDRQ